MRKACKNVLAVNNSTHMLKIKCTLRVFLDVGQRRQLTNEYSVQLTAHCRDLFFLCCLAALNEKTGVFLQCISILHKRKA